MTVETKDTKGTDRIEKTMEMRAPRSRVWRAITTAKEFGTWFRANLEGEFAPGATIHGKVAIPGYEHIRLEMLVERVEPESYFSYRWHPYPNDPAVDYSAEPMTLVEFFLGDSADGTTLRIVESGFDRLPATRRAEAFRMNEGGWNGQIRNIANHVS